MKLGDASKAFAVGHCSESVTVEFFRAQLADMLPLCPRSRDIL